MKGKAINMVFFECHNSGKEPKYSVAYIQIF